MTRLTRFATTLALLVPVAVTAQIPTYTGPKFEHTKLAEGVHAFVFDNPLGQAVDRR